MNNNQKSHSHNHYPQEDDQAFESITLSIANPEDILDVSYGEITKPETINYRTQKPERGGLFCEKIFGPVKNWECSCGKYKRIRYRGVICEKCGVEVTRTVVRRERMGHIKLAVPIAHNWFVRTLPSRVGLLCHLSVKDLERVVYFASYIIINVDETEKENALSTLDKEFKTIHKNKQQELTEKLNIAKADLIGKKIKQNAFDKIEIAAAEELTELELQNNDLKKSLKNLTAGNVISEIEYRNLSMRFGHIFDAGSGSEAIRHILENIDLEKLIQDKKAALTTASMQERKQISRLIALATDLHEAKIRPEWMILKVLPVLPPDLRPMVALEGGRFATSDLNDLYRRVINRNNRLKRLIDLGAPDVITRNEKRMLQESVDALISGEDKRQSGNFRVSGRRQLKSLSDMLKGKKGRFRQNLLGKRVDYSGRSVIVVGPKLRLDQCGLPKKIALRLFKPFIIGHLIRDELAYNVKSAERYIAEGHKEVWDILENVSKNHPIMLNRAPTLHRLGIQAFYPILIEGHAIQIHPLVCPAFNADFDGDMMAVHLPLSEPAKKEVIETILASKNVLKPSSGDPIITPSQDIILGVYYMTSIFPDKKGTNKIFADTKDAIRDYQRHDLHIQAQIKVKVNEKFIQTSVGRLLFNEIIDEHFGFINKQMGSKDVKELFSRFYFELGTARTVKFADDIKNIGFKHSTLSGLSIGLDDMIIPTQKDKITASASETVRQLNNQFWKGMITDEERYAQVIKVWGQVKINISAHMKQNFTPENHIAYMVNSGARGNWEQITQMCGMKGLVVNPGGKIIELPIINSLKEGFSVLEYFIATHGGRKGKADTALKTAGAGYLTRRLVDVSQDVLISMSDCGTEEFIVVGKANASFGESIIKKIFSRTLAQDIIHPKTAEIILEKGTVIDHNKSKKLIDIPLTEVAVYSPLTCNAHHGICKKCYGLDMAYAKEVAIGTPVGIIAAQSIGEPGTQLTMRSFHSGGVAQAGVDMATGLSRVEELFESRTPKFPAFNAEISGTVDIQDQSDKYLLTITVDNSITETIKLPDGFKPFVVANATIRKNQIIAKNSKTKESIKSPNKAIIIKVDKDKILLKSGSSIDKNYEIPARYTLNVKSGDEVLKGDRLTNGNLDLRKTMLLKDNIFVQKYIVSEIQDVYNSQGQTIHDKHIEIIVAKMFSKVNITDSGASEHITGTHIAYKDIAIENAILAAANKPLIEFEYLLLGLTKAALSTQSWLSAASFQETIRTLVSVATSRKIDPLSGLKENIIIGRLIPVGENYKDKETTITKTTKS